MNRVRGDWVSSCLGCEKQLTVSAVPFSGEVECPSCRAINSFSNAQKPSSVRGGLASNRMGVYEGGQGTIRSSRRQSSENSAVAAL